MWPCLALGHRSKRDLLHPWQDLLTDIQSNSIIGGCLCLSPDSIFSQDSIFSSKFSWPAASSLHIRDQHKISSTSYKLRTSSNNQHACHFVSTKASHPANEEDTHKTYCFLMQLQNNQNPLPIKIPTSNALHSIKILPQMIPR